jgi:hypothetical protein
MTQQPVLIQLPEELYERVRQVAQDSNRPLESILVDSLALLFGDLPDNAELTPQILATFSDEQLWAIVQRALAWPQDARLRELTMLGKQGILSAQEQTEMERLVDQVDRYVLVRSHALLLLKQRGHDVERRLKLGAL